MLHTRVKVGLQAVTSCHTTARLLVVRHEAGTLRAVLCGNNGEACWGKYGSYPLHRSYCHEMALRILLASIESHANRYKRHIVPVRYLAQCNLPSALSVHHSRAVRTSALC